MSKKILVADDDFAIGEMLQLMLEGAGYEVEIQTDGRTVQQMQEPLPDLLLLDIGMSGIDGRMICRQLKSQENTRRLPIILLSASNNMQRVVKDAEADDFLSKPFDMHDLLSLVAHYVGRTEAGS
jgi:CheY-like chemotaxis protein